MKSTRTIIVSLAVLGCILMGVIVIFSSVIKRGIESVRETIDMEIRNERLWLYSDELEEELTSEEFSEIKYIISGGQLLILGEVSDNETFDKVLQTVFSKPDILVYHISMYLDIYGEANVELIPPEKDSPDSEPRWKLIRRGYYFSDEIISNPKPGQQVRMGGEITEMYYDRDGNVIEGEQLENEPNITVEKWAKNRRAFGINE